MRTHRLIMLASLMLIMTACKPDASDARGSGREARAADPVSGSAQSRGQESTDPSPAAAAPGGAFAREPGFQLPVPVSRAPAGAGTVPPSRQVDPVDVRTALLEGMEQAGAGIGVRVSPGGIVSLTGEVATVAELQRAHYLARALPGVVEVDYRQLRVRQR